MLKSNSLRENEKDGARNSGEQICCLLENRERCRKQAGNASFNFRVKKLVKQRKLGLAFAQDVSILF